MTGLAGRLRANYPKLKVATGSTDPAGYDVVVNATPLGMKAGDPLPMDVSRIAPSTFVGEVVMKQEITPFPRRCARTRAANSRSVPTCCSSRFRPIWNSSDFARPPRKNCGKWRKSATDGLEPE